MHMKLHNSKSAVIAMRAATKQSAFLGEWFGWGVILERSEESQGGVV